MPGGDAIRVSIIQRGSNGQHHLGSILIHSENAGGTNPSELSPPIVGGILLQY